MNDFERYTVLGKMIDSDPFAPSYNISDANFNFLMRKVEEHGKLKKQNEKIKKVNYELESQIDRITMVMVARKEKPILERYRDIQTILGIDKFFPQGLE